MGTSIRDHPTKARLLDAAAGVFARHGFRDAGVREICAAAGVNQASVNYHFGSKEGLYSAVLQDAYDRAGPGWPMPRLADSPDNPEHALREGMIELDAVYSPEETTLLRQAAARGARTVGGKWMLVYQAVDQLQRWTALLPEPPSEAQLASVPDVMATAFDEAGA